MSNINVDWILQQKKLNKMEKLLDFLFNVVIVITYCEYVHAGVQLV